MEKKKYLCIAEEAYFGIGDTLATAYDAMIESTNFTVDKEYLQFFEITPINVRFDIIKIEN